MLKVTLAKNTFFTINMSINIRYKERLFKPFPVYKNMSCSLTNQLILGFFLYTTRELFMLNRCTERDVEKSKFISNKASVNPHPKPSKAESFSDFSHT